MNARNVERVGTWNVSVPAPSATLSPALERELDEIRSEAAPMLDPSWTPARGYGHAGALLATLARKEIGQ